MKFLLGLALTGCTLVVGEIDPRDHANADLSVNNSCNNVQTDVRNCGVCGHDCTRLAGVDPLTIRCTAGQCDLRDACLPGRADCSGGAVDGCETELSTASHCGNCTAVCGAQVPLCTRTPGGLYTCDSTCPFGTTQCGTSCSDVLNDPQHCGNCNIVCPTGNGQVALCQNGKCSTQCGVGFHSCGGVCSDDSSIKSCGVSCTPCPPAPAHGAASCDAVFGCDFTCDPGFLAQGSACVQNASMDLRGSDLSVDNRPLCDCSGIPACSLTATCVGQDCCQECTLGLPICVPACVEDPTCKPSLH